MRFLFKRVVLPSLFSLITVVIPLSSQAGANECLRTDLENATYIGIEDHPLTLSDGTWQGAPYVEGSASRPRVGLVKDMIFSGDLNADGVDEVATLLWQSGGGTGSNIYIAVMSRQANGLKNIASTLVGDRVQLRGGGINSGRLRLEVLQAGENDAMCCPTELATRNWSFVDGQLEEGEMEMKGKLSVARLEGTEWLLSRLDHNEPVIENAEVTLLFSEDRVAGKSACNRYSAGIEDGQNPGEIKIGLAMGTRMACPEELMTLERTYLDALSRVTGFSFFSTQLSLNGQKDDGSPFSLLFSRLKNDETQDED